MKLIFRLFIFVAIVCLVAGLAYREILIREYPFYVRRYQEIMRTICTEEYKEDLLTKYPELENQIGVEPLLLWLHERLNYTEDPYIIRYEDPIKILEYGLGRCGEFSIAFTAILYAQGYTPRMVMDLSPESSENGIPPEGIKDGDHVWVEYFYGTWIHTDPTEAREDDPLMYERDWGKILIEVWGIESNFCERIEENYQWVNE